MLDLAVALTLDFVGAGGAGGAGAAAAWAAWALAALAAALARRARSVGWIRPGCAHTHLMYLRALVHR